MIQNFFKIAWRSLLKNKGFTAINILGLAIGMAAAILILLWVHSELTYDRMYKKTDQLYLLGNKDKWNDETAVWFATPKPLATALKSKFPEIKNVTRMNSAEGFLFTVGEKKITPGSGLFVDTCFLDMFDLKAISGNAQQALRNPTEIVLTATLAENLFGTTDIVGKSVKVDSADVFTVGAVLEDMPSNSSLKNTKFFLPWRYMEKIGLSDESWGNNSVFTFIEVDPHTDIASLGHKIKDFSKKESEFNTAENVLKPLKEYWLYSKYENGKVVGGRIDTVNVFSIVAGLILLIACINFMNLSTAQSDKRAREVGVRKVVGARKSTLIMQFLAESVLIATIAGVLALIFVQLSVTDYSNLVDRKLSIAFLDVRFWLFFIGFILSTGILAGSYPAFFLSSFKPINVLKSKLFQRTSKISARKVLVVSQFSIAVVLIISTLVMKKQIQYGQDRESGYDKDRLIYVHDQGQISSKFTLIKQALLEQGIASSITRTMSPLTQRWSNSGSFYWDGKEEGNSAVFNRSTADDKLVETTGFTLVAGRDFDLATYPTDSSAAILNESAAKAMGFDEPIGKVIKDLGRDWHVIGVIKDFVQESPFEAVNPLVIEGAHAWMKTTHIKFAKNLNTREALAKTEKIFKAFNPDYPFEYTFIDEEYARKFDESQKTGKLASLFAGLTIFISCLGLFGLSAYMAESRIKEIGIRKVLGASVFSLTRLLSAEFLLLILLACIIAFPIAFWMMDSYLTKFTYRIGIGPEIFLVAGATALLITVITVSYQSIKAAIANPVDSLRDE
ncbi:ABC transporter permease [Sphingobacterium paludis]|uniref:FtsX-like permease family protein n=1 Tax=Sphingobacterium paludis TaxID=1476465 RepID=A0A4R7D6F0_9SPHI|nr:ABC transporter permease [Sphingobacterium paludis]TDS15952.1 FtsX-like permease family protein [Sphingobacterium paludis]